MWGYVGVVLVQSPALIAVCVAIRPEKSASQKEIRACRERTGARVAGLEKSKPLIEGDELAPQARSDAAKIVRFVCLTCGMCDGVAPPAPPRPAAPLPTPKEVLAPMLAKAKKSACRRKTRADLQAIATSQKPRDLLLRRGLADRCAKCALCPDMAG